MANPFLMTEEELAEDVPSQDAFQNPFLMDTKEDDVFQSDNPFFDQGNPFSDFEQPQETTNVEPAVTTTGMEFFMTEEVTTVTTTATGFTADSINTSFFDTTIHEYEDPVVAQKPVDLNLTEHHFEEPYSSEDELGRIKKKAPPPRPGPPPSTQDLILTVAGQLDLASSDLLGRIPVTRTPSPVSMRDLHSPSPTADLLDVDDPKPDLIENHSSGFDNPFLDCGDTDPPIEAHKPTPNRPPPPRPNPPPVKAVPPSRPMPPITQHPPPVAQQQDFMDIFGAEDPAPMHPPPPKSNEDILSLFSINSSNPTQQNTQPDLLFDDLPEMNTMPLTNETSLVQNITSDLPSSEMAVDYQREEEIEQPKFIEPLPETMTTIPVHDEAKSEISSEISASGSMATISGLPQSASGSIGNVASIEPEKEEELVMEVEKHQGVPNVDSDSANPFASPTDEERANEPLYEVKETIIAPQFVPRAAPPPRPAPPPVPRAKKIESPPNERINEEHHPVYNPVPVQAPIVPVQPQQPPQQEYFKANDDFDAFSAKFDQVQQQKTNIFLEDTSSTGDAWGDDTSSSTVALGGGGFGGEQGEGFGGEQGEFDDFLSMSAPPQPDMTRNDSKDSDEHFNVVIRPLQGDASIGQPTPFIAPPPKSSGENSPRVNPFDNRPENLQLGQVTEKSGAQFEKTDSQESPQTPLFDDDVSQPLEDFPRILHDGTLGWEMQLRQPNKKKITGQRFWKKIFIRLVYQGDNPVMQLLNAATDKEPFQELPLQACYSVSDIGAQQYDQFGKIFTVKLQYIFYKERPGVRPGQVTKAERITNKLSQFAAYAIQGDYQGVKEFGSDLKKLGLPVEHAPQISQLFKIGSMNYEDLKLFSVCVEEALFKLNVHRDRALTYKMEEVQLTAVDELYVEQDHEGRVLKQIARVRLFFLGFLSGMPTIELGVNDLWRQGKEVVGRHDIIPVVTEEWIRLEGVEFHGCVQLDEYERTRTIKFQPPDACYIELMRFRVRPPKNRELPLQVKATWCVTGNRVELRVDILVPGFASRKLGQIPCEDVSIRFPIPECWIYLFRVEKHFRYGSVKSAHRRTGKIKGIERILGTVDNLQESLIEVTSGQAKYEHHHRAIVWRCPRLPKEGQGAYTTHQMVCRMALTSFDQIPEQLAPYCYVEFTMPATQVSHTTVRSVSVQDSDSDEPPEKYVRYLARHEYRVGIEHTTGESMNSYLAATSVSKTIKEEPAQPLPAASPMAPSDSDSDSN